MEKREDPRTARLIDAALVKCSTYGIEVAAMAMAESGIPFEMVLRVLTLPRSRRAPGQRHYIAPEDYSAALAAAFTAS